MILDRPAAALFGASAVWLWPVLQERLGQAGLLLLLASASAVAALVPPYLTKLVIDEGLVAGDTRALLSYSVALFLFGAAALALSVVNTLLHMRASVGMLADIRRRVVDDVLARSMAWRSEQRTGEIVSRIDGDAGEVQQFALNALLTGTSSVLRLVGGAAMLFVLSPSLALLALLLAPFELVFLAWARPRTEALARTNRAVRGQFAASLVETIQGLNAIQIASAEAQTARRLSSQQGELNQSILAMNRFGEITRTVPSLLTAAMRSIVFVVGGLMVIGDGWPLGSLIAFLAYMAFLVGPMQSLLGLWHGQARVKAALSRLDDILLAPEPITWPAIPKSLPAYPQSLVFEKVDVTQSGRNLLRGVDLNISAGGMLALTGPSGTGKSSLLTLLQRHADPAAGRILLGGIDLRHLDKRKLREAVTLVTQRPFVLQGTVEDNLRLGNPNASDHAMLDALEFVELSDRFDRLDTRLGEDGLTVSGGERQRLCLARALLSPGWVVCLDEALSEVDRACSERIMQKLHQRLADRIKLIVAHGFLPTESTEIVDLTRWRPEAKS